MRGSARAAVKVSLLGNSINDFGPGGFL
jgi:hypothetical protein